MLVVVVVGGGGGAAVAALALLASPSVLAFFLAVVEEAGGVELPGVANGLGKQLHHLRHTGRRRTAKWKAGFYCAAERRRARAL